MDTATLNAMPDKDTDFRHVSRSGHAAPFGTPPSTPPVYLTAAFDIPDAEFLSQMHAGNAAGYIYTRDSNPNHAALADSIAALERAGAGAVFASGMGAIAAVILTLAHSGDHVIASRVLYGRSLQLLQRLQTQFGISVSMVDAADINSVQAAVRENTKLCLVETISNPLVEVADVAAIARAVGDVPLIVDSTFTTPELIRPLEHGAAAVVHSASKYLNGHGDVMLGVAAGSKELMAAATETASMLGQNANPFECWLTQRGLRTLPLRMRQICETTSRLAEFLNSHDCVRKVHHPLLPAHSSHATARRLYPNGTGGIISFELQDTNADAVSRFMKATAQIPFSPTLADARTTLSHPASTSHRYMSPEVRASINITDSLIRLSVGLEPFDLLQRELDDALGALR